LGFSGILRITYLARDVARRNGDIMSQQEVDPERVTQLKGLEEARFVTERPRSMTLLERAQATMPRGVPMSWMDDMWEHPPIWVEGGKGAYFTDVDGHEYLDMYIADMSAFLRAMPLPR
jgi:glutamate-1-semialdehyde 2,1-aminomutase